ncbi:hypothetical protein KIPB_014981, partial [Kipferlia bialata]|eukprot:g14981.t1
MASACVSGSDVLGSQEIGYPTGAPGGYQPTSVNPVTAPVPTPGYSGATAPTPVSAPVGAAMGAAMGAATTAAYAGAVSLEAGTGGTIGYNPTPAYGSASGGMTYQSDGAGYLSGTAGT